MRRVLFYRTTLCEKALTLFVYSIFLSDGFFSLYHPWQDSTTHLALTHTLAQCIQVYVQARAYKKKDKLHILLFKMFKMQLHGKCVFYLCLRDMCEGTLLTSRDTAHIPYRMIHTHIVRGSIMSEYYIFASA